MWGGGGKAGASFPCAPGSGGEPPIKVTETSRLRPVSPQGGTTTAGGGGLQLPACTARLAANGRRAGGRGLGVFPG